MAKKGKKLKDGALNVANEFKAFISKGSIVDLSVGVIIGGAFTAIVTALTNGIFNPLINWLLSLIGGKDALASARTVLSPVYNTPGQSSSGIDWSSSIYIDWGSLISAIINFLLIALILFIIVKAIAVAKAETEKAKVAAKEAYYQKHPEERPVPPTPGVPEPTDHELLKQMVELMKAQNEKKDK